MTGRGCLVKRFGWNQRIALKRAWCAKKMVRNFSSEVWKLTSVEILPKDGNIGWNNFPSGLESVWRHWRWYLDTTRHRTSPYMLYPGYTPDFQISEIPCPADAMSRSPASQLTQQVRCLPTCQVSKPGSQICQVPQLKDRNGASGLSTGLFGSEERCLGVQCTQYISS